MKVIDETPNVRENELVRKYTTRAENKVLKLDLSSWSTGCGYFTESFVVEVKNGKGRVYCPVDDRGDSDRSFRVDSADKNVDFTSEFRILWEDEGSEECFEYKVLSNYRKVLSNYKKKIEKDFEKDLNEYFG